MPNPKPEDNPLLAEFYRTAREILDDRLAIFEQSEFIDNGDPTDSEFLEPDRNQDYEDSQ